MSRIGVKVTSALFGLILWAGAGSAIAAYSVLDLGTLGGPSSVAEGVSSRSVVGTTGEVFHSIPFLWKDGTMTGLTMPVGIDAGWAYGVNARGQIVGTVTTTGGPITGFLYESGAMTLLPSLGGSDCRAAAISGRGEVVGSSTLSDDPSLPPHACLWRDGKVFDLGSLGGYCSASGINERGEVVGSSITANGESHAFLWRQGAMIDLGTLEGNGTFGTDINNFGVVVGYASAASGEIHAYMWKDDHMINLGRPGEFVSIAASINDRGQIVGWGQATPLDPPHAILWDHGTMTDLGTLGGLASKASEIDEDGWIVGHGQTASGSTHAALWIPQTEAEPTSLAPSLTSAALSSGRSSSKPRAVITRYSNSAVTLSFVAPGAGDATIRLFDVSGRLVREVWNALPVSAGRHEVLIDGKNQSGALLPAGVYYYRLAMGDWSLSGKVWLAK